MEAEDCAVCWSPMPAADRNFRPCPCGFRFCVWCWHRIFDADFSETLQVPRCPSCREPLSAAAINTVVASGGSPGSPNRAAAAAKRQAYFRSKVEPAKRPLIDLVVEDRRVVVVDGLPHGLFGAPADVTKHEYFGQYGRIVNYLVADTSVAIRYATAQEAELCAARVKATGGGLEARIEPSKWGRAYLRGVRCTRRYCVDLHEPRRSDVPVAAGVTAAELHIIRERPRARHDATRTEAHEMITHFAPPRDPPADVVVRSCDLSSFRRQSGARPKNTARRGAPPAARPREPPTRASRKHQYPSGAAARKQQLVST